jgi:large conductance mechanosensitive channel
MKIIKEFKEFAVKGNVVDMALGIIIGAAFGKIVSSLVADVITPPLGVVLGGVDFSGLNVILKDASASAPAVSLNYGKFIQSLVDFLIVALAMFSMVKLMNRLKRAEQSTPVAPPPPTKDQQLLGEIRDLLKAGK